MVSIGSLYHLIPKVFGREKMYSLGLINAHFWLATIGTVLYIASMWVNGITQGLMWRAVNEAHAYRQAMVERPDIPNRLNREFAVQRPNQVWCGDIMYIWAQGRWHYLAAVLDLQARRVIGWAFSAKPDAELVIKALDMAYITPPALSADTPKPGGG